MIGAVETFGNGPDVKSILPIVEVMLSLPIAAARATLSFGSVAAAMALVAASNRAAVVPMSWFHCRPVWAV